MNRHGRLETLMMTSYLRGAPVDVVLRGAQVIGVSTTSDDAPRVTVTLEHRSLPVVPFTGRRIVLELVAGDLDAATTAGHPRCVGCGLPLPASEAAAGWTRCEYCPPADPGSVSDVTEYAIRDVRAAADGCEVPVTWRGHRGVLPLPIVEHLVRTAEELRWSDDRRRLSVAVPDGTVYRVHLATDGGEDQ